MFNFFSFGEHNAHIFILRIFHQLESLHNEVWYHTWVGFGGEVTIINFILESWQQSGFSLYCCSCWIKVHLGQFPCPLLLSSVIQVIILFLLQHAFSITYISRVTDYRQRLYVNDLFTRGARTMEELKILLIILFKK